ncbi:MAG: acyl esterase [Alphaproteobacteria bacterium]|nr:acyl esterase [Alphaproteobacteria bacterium]
MDGGTKADAIVDRLGVRFLTGPAESDVTFTIVTLVARQDRYERLLRSAEAKGFDRTTCQFLALDNRGSNRFDGFDAIRRTLCEARGRYVVFTHDDVEFHADGADQLLACLEDLERRDPRWLLAGNAGGSGAGKVVRHLVDPHDRGIRVQKPVLVEALDENFFVMRRDHPVVHSCDLSGFHFYAADLCRLAEIMGGRSYVIPFLLTHHSPGGIDATFKPNRKRFERKYRRYFPGRKLQLTVTEFNFGLGGLREGWCETPQSRWDFLADHVYAPSTDTGVGK